MDAMMLNVQMDWTCAAERRCLHHQNSPTLDTRWKEEERTAKDHLATNGGTRTEKPPPHLGNDRHSGPRPAEVEGFRRYGQ